MEAELFWRAFKSMKWIFFGLLPVTQLRTGASEGLGTVHVLVQQQPMSAANKKNYNIYIYIYIYI